MIKFAVIAPKRAQLPQDPTPKLERELHRWSGATVRRITRYPPQQPTKYVRTNRLGAQWKATFKRTGGSLVATVENNMPYAPFVQGEATQSRVMKAKGWETIEEAGLSEWDDVLGPIIRAFAP